MTTSLSTRTFLPSTLIPTLTLLLLALSTPLILPTHALAVDHLPPPISVPLQKVARRSSSQGWAENIVNLKSSIKLDDSLASGTLPLLEARLADLTHYHIIQDRISSKWSQKGNQPPSSSSSSSSSSTSLTDNEAIKRANRGHLPLNLKKENNNSKKTRFAKVKKRQGDGNNGDENANAPFPPSADDPPQPTLASTRNPLANYGQAPAKTPLYDDIVAREDIEVSCVVPARFLSDNAMLEDY